MLRPIDGVADHGVAEGGEVDANLVRASRLEREGHGGRAGEPLEHAVVRDGAHAMLSGPRGSAAAVAAVADDVEADGSRVVDDASFHERDVCALDVVASEELLQPAQDLAGAGEDDRAGGLLVEPMDDADIGALPVAELEVGVDAREQRVPFARLGRERQEAGGLVGDHELGVLVQDDEARPHRADRRPVDVEMNARLLAHETPGLAARNAVDVDPSRFDVLLGLASGEGMRAGNPEIETHGPIVRRALL